ncbi:MAG: ABC transporter ATP-binding protein [Eubacterium sp.]|nr:ABC transporter ATP-binding protein [Eubacterium sp.]
MMKKDRFPTNTSLLFYFLRGSKRYFALAISFAALVSVLDLVNPRIIGYTVDSVLGEAEDSLPAIVRSWLEGIGGTAWVRGHLWAVAFLVIGVALGSMACRFLFRLNNATGAETLVKRMRDTLFGHIMQLPFKWHSENHTGDIIQRCTSDVEMIKTFLSEHLTSLLRVIVLIVMALVFMYDIDPGLTLVSGVFIPVIIGYSLFFHRKIGEQFLLADEEEGVVSSIAQENLTGVRVVRAFGREQYERERFETRNEGYTNLWTRLMRLMAAFWSFGDFFSYGQLLAVTVYGAWLCVHGRLTPGEYIAFVSYNNLLTHPVRMLGRVIANMSRAGISLERLRYIMNSEAEKDREGAVCPDMHADIVFDHVSYQYDNGTAEVLHDIDLTIKAGSTVGILGGTGSGKSTLMYLMDRLYELPPEAGKITIGGVDIADIKAEHLRANIGMVLQEPYLFSRSLSENIRIAARDTTMQDVRRAARIAALEDTIARFKEGFDTFVGERGVTLSGGQKQRAAVAQMLIRKPPIMVFDDSLSAVDAETDAKIRAALKENIGDATVILIGQRITTLMGADDIVVMDGGRIAEQGTHEELLEKGGIYRRIYDLQMQQSEMGEEA